MKILLLVGLFGTLWMVPVEARNLAKEIYDKELEKIDPLRSIHRLPEDELALSQGVNSSSAGEGLEGNALTQRPDDDYYPSLNEYLTERQEQEIFTEDIFLINGKETMDGQKKLRLNPELLKRIRIPEEKKKLSWWDEFLEYMGGVFS